MSPADAAYHPLVGKVVRALRQRCGVGSGARVLVATSGGADSVALLRALVTLAPRRRWKLVLAVGHVQHHLRDQDGAAEADAAFVAALAERFELPLLRADLDLARDTDGRGNVEARARRARYAALATMAAGFDARFLAVAHHADDQLETLLMRLLRGASVQGLASMAWRRTLTTPGGRALLIRPLLRATRAEVVDYLHALGQPWREDHTNLDMTRFRGRLRHELLPRMRALAPQAARRATDLCDHLRQVQAVLEQAVSNAADRVVVQQGEAVLDRVEARLLSEVVLSALLRRLLLEAGASADALGRQTLARIARAAADRRGGERVFDVRPRCRVTVTRDAVRITAGAGRR